MIASMVFSPFGVCGFSSVLILLYAGKMCLSIFFSCYYELISFFTAAIVTRRIWRAVSPG
jgi:hypothetical protein